MLRAEQLTLESEGRIGGPVLDALSILGVQPVGFLDRLVEGQRLLDRARQHQP